MGNFSTILYSQLLSNFKVLVQFCFDTPESITSSIFTGDIHLTQVAHHTAETEVAPSLPDHHLQTTEIHADLDKN